MRDKHWNLDLLTEENAQKFLSFAEKTIAHPFLKSAYDQLRLKIRILPSDTVLFLFGPTGVGKSTLMDHTVDELNKEMIPELEKDPGRIPLVKVELITPTSGSFDWKDFFTTGLKAIEEPLIDKKIDYGVRSVKRNQDGKLVITDRANTLELRHAFESAMRQRSTDVCFVDEAQTIGKMAGARNFQNQLEIIKSMQNASKTIYVLIGTYELLPFLNLNGQLARRTREIHFSRYRADNEEEWNIFEDVVYTFQKLLPLPQESNLFDNLVFLYEKSIGCIGILKSLLDQALFDALRERSKKLTFKHLQDNALSNSKCIRIAKEAMAGEAQLDDSDKYQELQSILKTSVRAVNTEDNHELTKPEIKRPKTAKRTAGTRKPKRDPVGMA
jgi:hypothetical protein